MRHTDTSNQWNSVIQNHHNDCCVCACAIHTGYVYSPFGAVTATLGNNPNVNPFRFSSEYSDAEIGLVYYNYRHYNPQDGRWISRDPIEERGGLNLFAYVKNNINSTDILGLDDSQLNKNKEDCKTIVDKTIAALSDPNSTLYKYMLKRMKEKGVNLSDCPPPTASCKCCGDGSKGFYDDKTGKHGTILICYDRPGTFTKKIAETVAHELDHHIQRCARGGRDAKCDERIDDEIESYRNAPTILGGKPLTIDELLVEDVGGGGDKDKEYLRRIIESVMATWANKDCAPSKCWVHQWGKVILDRKCLEDEIRVRARKKINAL